MCLFNRFCPKYFCHCDKIFSMVAAALGPRLNAQSRTTLPDHDLTTGISSTLSGAPVWADPQPSPPALSLTSPSTWPPLNLTFLTSSLRAFALAYFLPVLCPVMHLSFKNQNYCHLRRVAQLPQEPSGTSGVELSYVTRGL